MSAVARNVILVLAVAAPRLLAADSPPESPQEILARLVATWEGQRSEIVTAHIVYVEVMQRATVPHSPEELRTLVNDHNLAARPAEVADFFDKLGVDTSRLESSPNAEFWCERTKTRYESQLAGTPVGVELVTDELEIDHDFANKQVTVHRKGGSVRARRILEEFRLLPLFDPSSLHIVYVGNQQVQLQTLDRTVQMTVDRSTGLVTDYLYSDAAGRPGQQVLQREIVSYPGEIHFPQLHVQATYEAGVLGPIGVTVIRDAAFNLDIAEDRWRLATTSETKIWDARRGRDSMRFRGQHAVADVGAFVVGTAAADKPFGWGRWLGVIGALAVLGACLVIWWRRRAQVFG